MLGRWVGVVPMSVGGVRWGGWVVVAVSVGDEGGCGVCGRRGWLRRERVGEGARGSASGSAEGFGELTV